MHGIFVERRLRRLLEYGGASASVVAPVPWFPFKTRLFGRYANFAAIPTTEVRHGIDVHHPRFPLIPKVGMLLAPIGMARASASTVRQLIAERGPFSIIDAHYFYPDGVAASMLADQLELPFVVTARGSDINVIAALPKPRNMILLAASKACAVITVSESLARKLEDLGVDSRKIHVLRNGVDLSFFQPGDRQIVRRKLKFNESTFISVGALKEEKGHDIAIESLQYIEDARLVVIGAGQFEAQLRKRVKSLQLESRVIFAGRLDADSLLEYYQAADALLLASKREGMPNVVLESVACGTPVVAADTGGIREILQTPMMGELLHARQPRAVAEAWNTMVQRGIDRTAIRRAAQRLSSDATIGRLSALMCGFANNVSC